MVFSRWSLVDPSPPLGMTVLVAWDDHSTMVIAGNKVTWQSNLTLYDNPTSLSDLIR
ncbi:hypothetical protein [Thiomicrorhabdus sp. Milos-T2]|uniref:hypothetical protein n=1 Tax=Thiomicrorhabdus sp. Milos-T2 TaxID=90814 RepID=UPI00131A408B|nr:hypothetical protein [Thiomicrorhabdus sp. Milos-T2]